MELKLALTLAVSINSVQKDSKYTYIKLLINKRHLPDYPKYMEMDFDMYLEAF